MKRHQQILAGVLVLQVILTVVVFWPSPVSTGEAEPLFENVTLDEIVSLTIADEQGNRIALAKQGEAWVVPEADDYPARSAAVTSALSKTLQLEAGTVVARTPQSHKQLKVAEDAFVRRVIFETSDERAYVLYVGSSPSYGATHVRLEGQDETYLTRSITSYDLAATANTWIDTNYFSVSPQNVTAMTVENALGTLNFVKDGETWTLQGLPEDDEADSGQISTLLNRAAAVRMTQPLGKTEEPAYGMDQPNATVTLAMTNTTHTLTIGTRDVGDNTYVVKSSESPYYVKTNAASVDSLVNAVQDNYIKAEPTPTPEPAEE